jgi:hypothetical protein
VADVSEPTAVSTNAPEAMAAPGGPAANQGMAARVTRGAMWSFIALAISQGASIGSQVVLGYKLKTEFALYMVAVAALSTIGIIRDVGLRKILIVRGDDYAALARPVFIIAFAINLLCALVLVALAPYLARHSFETPQPTLVPMMWVIAASVAVSSFGTVQSAKLAIDLRFKAIAAQVAVSGVVRQVAQAGFALAGFGAMSFVWPMLVVAIFDAVSYRWLGGAMPKGGRLTRDLFVDLFHLSKWIIVALLGTVLTYRADGFIVARFEDLENVVTYYGWAIALTVQALQPFTYVIYSTVLPAFARINSDPMRTRLAYLRMASVVTFVAAPAVLWMCLVSPLGIHLVWRGKWDTAIPAVALILAATPFKSLQACALAFDESHSRFRRAAILLIADGATALIAVTIGVLSGGLVAIASAILIQRIAYNSFHAFYVGHSAGLSRRKMLARISPPLLVAALIGTTFVLWPSMQFGAGSSKAYLYMGVLSVPAVLIYAAFAYAFFRDRWAEALEIVRSRGK